MITSICTPKSEANETGTGRKLSARHGIVHEHALVQNCPALAHSVGPCVLDLTGHGLLLVGEAELVVRFSRVHRGDDTHAGDPGGLDVTSGAIMSKESAGGKRRRSATIAAASRWARCSSSGGRVASVSMPVSRSEA